MKKAKMTIEVWSDIVCPSCYIGKRKLEGALARFEDRDNIEVIWRSFQLEPDYVTDAGKNLYQVLEEYKGLSREQAAGAFRQMAGMAQQAGLTYNFEKTIPANSFRAHQLSHMAMHHGRQSDAEEALFRTYFTDGCNIDDPDVLLQLGNETGLIATEVTAALETGRYAAEVHEDLAKARSLGITSIPAFLFDGKVRVTGAQESDRFLEILEQTIAVWKNEATQAAAAGGDGQACSIGGNCV